MSGQESILDRRLTEAALDWYLRNVPADTREPGGPFGPVVAVDEGADAYTRPAGYVGRPVG